jgi:sugar phosphate isomerase/epimerase
MKLSFSTNAFVNYSVFEAVERIAAIGYQGVELLADVPHLYVPSVTAADLQKLAELLDQKKLQVANINANTAMGYYGMKFWEPLFEPSLANPDSAARGWRIDYSKKCIDMARVLGSRTVSLTSGRMVSGSTPQEGLRLLQDSLRELLEHAEKSEVRLGIEYEPGLLIERCEELVTLVEKMDSPYLGANLDLGHSHVLGEDHEEIIARLSHRIFHLHIEDIQDRKHYHLVPGLGEVDFAALLGSLEKHSYDGFVTVELYTYPQDPEAAARESLAYLKALNSKARG